jgi:hypothetical protein
MWEKRHERCSTKREWEKCSIGRATWELQHGRSGMKRATTQEEQQHKRNVNT